jgi:hypothetical protein
MENFSNVPIATDSGCIFIKQKVIKHDLLPHNSAVLVAGVDITKSLLEKTTFTQPTLCQGRYLWSLAQATMRVIKKAVAILEILPEVEFIATNGDIVYISGKNDIDAKESLLAAMYVELKGKPGLKDKDNKREDTENHWKEN